MRKSPIPSRWSPRSKRWRTAPSCWGGEGPLPGHPRPGGADRPGHLHHGPGAEPGEHVPKPVGAGNPHPSGPWAPPRAWRGQRADSSGPSRGRITSPFGGRQIFGGENFHRGLDIAAPNGTPIAASARRPGDLGRTQRPPTVTWSKLTTATALPPITPTAPSFWSRRATRSPRDKPSPLWAPPAGPPAPTATLNCFGRTSFWTPSFVYLDNLPDGAFPVPSGKFFSSSFHFFCKRRCTAPFFPGISKFLPQVPCHLAKTRPFPAYNASFLSLP